MSTLPPFPQSLSAFPGLAGLACAAVALSALAAELESGPPDAPAPVAARPADPGQGFREQMRARLAAAGGEHGLEVEDAELTISLDSAGTIAGAPMAAPGPDAAGVDGVLLTYGADSGVYKVVCEAGARQVELRGAEDQVARRFPLIRVTPTGGGSRPDYPEWNTVFASIVYGFRSAR